MRKITPCVILGLCCVAFYPRPAAALNFSAPKPKFGYTDASGKKQSIEVVDKYYPRKLYIRLPEIRRSIQSCAEPRPLQRNAREHILFPSAGTT